VHEAKKQFSYRVLSFAACMRYIWPHIRYITDHYNGGIPLTHFLKNYFRQHKQLGSRDRKIITEMAYCWYRCSKALPEGMDFETQIKTCLFVCDTSINQTLQFLPETWQAQKSRPVSARIEMLRDSGLSFNLSQIASFPYRLSEGILENEWLGSLLHQPKLFLRIRKNRKHIERLLLEKDVPFDHITDACIALPNGAAVDKFLPESDYVVQDASSQSTGSFFRPAASQSWWDCCSGAGGKSLLLKDMEPRVTLTVSDKRKTILHNLAERFRIYGHQQPEQIVADVSDIGALQAEIGTRRFDHIICDVPCTGSGTWARTPEQLYFFEEERIAVFARLQRSIASNALKFLKPGGRLFYITCSVFASENEAVVNNLSEGYDLEVEEMKLINGIEISADSMFIAVLGLRS
jgi:16S rRNA (cytosine967-C5)-methyltransferase